MAVMVYSDAWGKLIHEKNQKSKISWHCPFKCLQIRAPRYLFQRTLKGLFHEMDLALDGMYG